MIFVIQLPRDYGDANAPLALKAHIDCHCSWTVAIEMVMISDGWDQLVVLIMILIFRNAIWRYRLKDCCHSLWDIRAHHLLLTLYESRRPTCAPNKSFKQDLIGHGPKPRRESGVYFVMSLYIVSDT